MTHPRFEDLVTVQVLEHLGSSCAVDESAGEASEPYPLDISRVRASDVLALVSTGAIYVVPETISELGQGAVDMPDEALFPPLPCPRTIIEVTLTEPRGNGRGGPFVLCEIQQGEAWFICYLTETADDAADQEMGIKRIAVGNGLYAACSYATREHPLARLWSSWGHVLSARNIPHIGIPAPRSARRRLERFKQRTPVAYWLDLDKAGEITSRPSDRRVTVRHLVVGHRRWIEARGRYTWVRAHIRGPVGAPWKGRPIHHRSAA